MEDSLLLPIPQPKYEEQEIRTPLENTRRPDSEGLPDEIRKNIEYLLYEDRGDIVRDEYKCENLGEILVAAFNNREGPFIEVAGPTPEGYGLVDFEKLPKKVWVSNIKLGLPIWEMDSSEPKYYIGKVDFQADSTKLSLQDQSVGAFFGSRLIYSTIPNTIEEFARALEEGGIVVLQGVPAFTLKLLRKQGFEIKYFIKYSSSEQSQRVKVDLIAFKKDKVNKNKNSSKKKQQTFA